MRLSAHRSPLATVISLLLLGWVAVLVLAPHARAYNPLFKGPVVGISDGLDWGTGKDDSGHKLRPGDRIRAVLRIGNGIPGQAGYRTSSPAPVAGRKPRKPVMLTGPTRMLERPGAGDGAVHVRLPFPFPFGGLRERTASVSASGWISFGSPALGSWEKLAEDDRGAAVVAGNFERGIMPYWGEPEWGEEGGGMKMVTAADGHSVAFQWEAGQDGGAPQRSFQLVLFRDGRFRFDYPGRNAPGGPKAFIGYSLGSGPDGYHPIATDTRSVLAGSVLVSPRSVKGVKTLPAGRSVLDLPAGADPNLPRECNIQQLDEELGPGEGLPLEGPTICWIPALKPGQEAHRVVSFRAPGAKGAAKKEVSTPAALRYAAVYAEGPQVLGADLDEVRLSGPRHHHPREDAHLTVLPTSFESGPPVVGQPWKFSVVFEESGTPADTLEEVKMTYSTPASAPIELLELSGFGGCSQRFPPMPVSCEAPSGLLYSGNYIVVNPTEAAVGSAIPLSITASAPGAATVTTTYSSPPVVAAP